MVTVYASFQVGHRGIPKAVRYSARACESRTRLIYNERRAWLARFEPGNRLFWLSLFSVIDSIQDKIHQKGFPLFKKAQELLFIEFKEYLD